MPSPSQSLAPPSDLSLHWTPAAIPARFLPCGAYPRRTTGVQVSSPALSGPFPFTFGLGKWRGRGGTPRRQPGGSRAAQAPASGFSDGRLGSGAIPRFSFGLAAPGEPKSPPQCRFRPVLILRIRLRRFFGVGTGNPQGCFSARSAGRAERALGGAGSKKTVRREGVRERVGRGRKIDGRSRPSPATSSSTQSLAPARV